MSAPAAFLRVLAEKLRGAGVPWMLTGSAASSYYGEPRATNDLDIVVDPTPAQIDAFAESLSGSFYVNREEVREALAARGMFNVIDPQSGWKADIIFVGNREFDRIEFGRRRIARLFGLDIHVISPEGSILSKLEWARRGGSDRQLRDAAAVLAANRGALDFDYLRRQARALRVDDLLGQLLG
ncbi:MAG: hypothetical protein ACHQJD_06475 [Thermoanaerobaculia bacterium]